jgi:hypothetical protein
VDPGSDFIWNEERKEEEAGYSSIILVGNLEGKK